MNLDQKVGEHSGFTRARVVIIGGVIPIAIGVVATILMFSWLPELPNPIAVHWSGSGADGFGPAIPFVVTPAIIAVVFSCFAVAWSWKPSLRGRLNWNQKLILVTAVWLSTLLSIGFGSSVALQRGLSDARNASDVGPSLAIGVGVGLVLAAIAWFLLPPGESTYESGTEASPVSVTSEERLSWSHSARFGTPALLIGSVSLVVAAAAVVAASVASQNVIVFGVATVVLIAVLLASNTWWRVSADRRGFTVRSILGWPAKRIPLDDIRTVQVTEVQPTRDFGGYGWRWAGNGRSGVILRAGKAIEVTASSGKRFFVTVDDADTGAGVLAALLTQHAAQ